MTPVKITWAWRPVLDLFVDRAFVISPIFGTLHSIPISKGCELIVPSWFWILGCKKSLLSYEGWLNEGSVDPRGVSRSSSGDPRHTKWSQDIRQRFAQWPFYLVIAQVDQLFARYKYAHALPDHSLNTSDLLLAMNDAWKISGEPECLTRSLFRLGWFRAMGRHPALVIGVHTPTDRLHAWLELDGRIIGEDYDDMLCFQGSIRYFLSS